MSSMAMATKVIYTREDAWFLTLHESLEADRIIGVETGGCPTTGDTPRYNQVVPVYAAVELIRR